MDKTLVEDPETEPTMAWLADELEKKLKLLDVKNEELNKELDRVHDKIREKDRVIKEFVDVISDKIKHITHT